MRNNYIFGLLCMIKCHVCVSAFPCACERTCVGILYVSALVCLCVCLSFVLNALFNLSQTSPGKKERKKKPFSYQVKSHGKLTEHCLYHPAAAHAWLESTAGQIICTVLMYIENIYFVLPAHKTMVY